MNLDFKNKHIAEIIKEKAIENNLQIYIVGGVTRDLILEKEINDIDFLIEGSAINFVQKSGFKIKSIHESFDTAKIEIEGKEIDIASTRCEKYPTPGCLPVVDKIGVKIEEDLKRRDFTVNSIAINLLTGEIIDPYNGKKDIKDRVLKVLHKNSFKDDPTRILRGLDFKYRFNFDFLDYEKNLIKETTVNYDNKGLSIDRIYLTLNKIFKNDFCFEILSDILEFEIYKIWMRQTSLNKKEVLRLKEISTRFKIEEKEKLLIMALEAFPYLKAPLKNDFEIYEFFKKFNTVQLAFYYFKTKDENALKYLEIKDIKPILTGKDLIEAGFPQGKIIGDILNSILKEKIIKKGYFQTFEEELDFAIRNFK